RHRCSQRCRPAADLVVVDRDTVPLSRILVLLDPDLIESAAVVLLGALEVATAVPGVELALVVQGVPEVTPAIGDAIAGVLAELAGRRPLPDVVVYGEPEGVALPAAVRVALSHDQAENARSVLTLALAYGPAPL
ncbi:hypothetical protein, partial [Dactylosporangium siamense]|uniref:hypothetical protein n=1 Tax=Dactylosporangium siamense TaxID=685454 RepID=UPI0031ED4BB8